MVNNNNNKSSRENSGPIAAPFLLKCYEMVDDPTTDSLISWSLANDSFIIWNHSLFTAQLLPKYFKHNTFSSFQRQLNLYGFKKNDTDRWEFANDGFIKDQKHLLMSINRKKASQLTTQQKVAKPNLINISAHEGNKYADLWKKVESLKTDKNMLMQGLVKQRQHQKTSQNKMLVLREQLKGMEQDQEQMLSFIVVAMQNPGFLANPVRSIENNWLGSEPSCNTVLKPVRKGSEHVVRLCEGAIVRYHPPSEDLDSTSEDSGEPDLTFEELEDLLENMDLLSGSPQNENHGPFIIHDPSDSDRMLDQLLSGPSSENDTTSF